MYSKPKISIICPSYNHGHFVSDFIQSLLVQSESSWELVIVDDASMDDNVEKSGRSQTLA